GALVWAATSSWSEDRLASLIEPVEAVGEPLADAVLAEDEAAVQAIVAELEARLDAEILVLPRLRGRRFGQPIGEPGEPGSRPPPRPVDHPLTRAEAVRLRQGQPLVRRHGLRPPV